MHIQPPPSLLLPWPWAPRLRAYRMLLPLRFSSLLACPQSSLSTSHPSSKAPIFLRRLLLLIRALYLTVSRLPPANGPTPEGPSPPRAHGSAAAYALGGFFQVSRNEASRFGWSGRWFQWM
ncbi:uncharacterized protein K441DRAFT_47550 [Cenococcum geophilum 1.58]|uniref:uncharacterized protein n=1 Tax=Cenococcum geophilum 1.58 TaxID=794803 RepID=UPI00358E4BFA|nr:hypothetical protein K441DRAFT_47550 [Cenococcum geophilum 1.58]